MLAMPDCAEPVDSACAEPDIAGDDSAKLINEACSIEAIEKQYEEFCAKEKQLQRQLEEFTEQRCNVGARLAALSRVAADMQLVHTDAQQLSKMISFTSQLAFNVSAKVKQLDLAKTRGAQTQQRVNDLLELQSCAEGVRQALVDEHYEQAAAHVHRYLSIDQSSTALLMTSSSSADDRLVASVSMLQRTEAKLETVVKQRFQQAVRVDDVASIERFFKIFPLLNKHEQGVQMFAEYLCSKIDQNVGKICRDAESCSINAPRSSLVWADSVTMLFESIARLIELHQPIIETFYGAGWLMMTAAVLQSSCDKHMQTIVDKYQQSRRLKQKVNQVNEFLRSTDSSQLDSGSVLDARDLDPFLTELTVVSSRTELYIRFLRRRVMADIALGYFDNERTEKAAVLEKMLADCRVSHLVQQLMAHYITLDSFYMTQCVRKAVKLDSLETGSLTSSIVDDTFFILKKCLRRAISTGNVDCTCAMINIAINQFETQFVGAVETHLKAGFPSGYLDLSQAYSVLQSSFQQGKLASVSGDAEQQKSQFLTALNNCHTSVSYMQQLCDDLSTECSTQFPVVTAAVTDKAANSGSGITTTASPAERSRQKLDSCLSTLRGVCDRLNALITSAVRQIRTSAIRPRVRPWLDTFSAESRDIGEAEFSRRETEEALVAILIGHLDQLVKSFSSLLLPDIVDMFNRCLLHEVAVQTEKVVLKNSYSRYGGLQLDKEMRHLVAYLLSITSWTERDKLARLTQMATILNMEQVSEIQDYWGSGSQIEWKLSPAEVRRVMSLRVDFRSEDVRRIKL